MQLHTDIKSPFVNFRFWLLQIFCENAQLLQPPPAFYYILTKFMHVKVHVVQMKNVLTKKYYVKSTI